MAANKQLSRFVRDALIAGKTHSEIEAALAQSGWTISEIADALDAWVDAPFSPPIPRPQATVSARDFFIYTLTFGLLIFGAWHLVSLFHTLIDLMFDEPDAFRRYTSIRWAMAVLIVTAPTFLWLTLRERAKLAADPSLYRSADRKWAIYITLLVAASVLLGDLVATIYALLNGDLTAQFVMKAAVVGVVAGGIFLFYLNDVRKEDAT